MCVCVEGDTAKYSCGFGVKLIMIYHSCLNLVSTFLCGLIDATELSYKVNTCTSLLLLTHDIFP